jgi:hypothetical protein
VGEGWEGGINKKNDNSIHGFRDLYYLLY